MATPTKPNSRLGTYIFKTFKDESFRAYVPPPSPLARQLLLPLLESQANQALARFDGLASILPDPSLFIYSARTCRSNSCWVVCRLKKLRKHGWPS